MKIVLWIMLVISVLVFVANTFDSIQHKYSNIKNRLVNVLASVVTFVFIMYILNVFGGQLW